MDVAFATSFSLKAEFSEASVSKAPVSHSCRIHHITKNTAMCKNTSNSSQEFTFISHLFHISVNIGGYDYKVECKII